jgi:pimeloyl-ACP methyl ester carboxylesterase
MFPFKINVLPDILADLEKRLQSVRWPDEPEVQNKGWDYGTNPEYLKELTDYWLNQYNWRQQEEQLNRFHHFKTTIDGITIHFIHEKGKGPNPTPILLTHGWPDSFYRYHKIIPMLTDPGSYGGDPSKSFDVIVPSIPGFGFSDKVALAAESTSHIWAKLMKETLGYSQYVAAGGDLGTSITKFLALNHPEAVKAIHLTDVGFIPAGDDVNTYTPAEKEFLKELEGWVATEGAYNNIQSTKPQTLAYGLNDSPVGLAAWIIEKLYAWSDCKGNIENCFTKDEIITNVMIYWITQTVNSSVRTYLQNSRFMKTQPGGRRIDKYLATPTAVAVFKGDVVAPEDWARRRVNLQRYNRYDAGGHFAAIVSPELYGKDLLGFFQQL